MPLEVLNAVSGLNVQNCVLYPCYEVFCGFLQIESESDLLRKAVLLCCSTSVVFGRSCKLSWHLWGRKCDWVRPLSPPSSSLSQTAPCVISHINSPGSSLPARILLPNILSACMQALWDFHWSFSIFLRLPVFLRMNDYEAYGSEINVFVNQT